ncbi:heavy metal translocating P-type ATPase [Nocardioides bruguierae]|nr:heavy metal translocating P-type ATPase [Nocardioides bruguierae]
MSATTPTPAQASSPGAPGAGEEAPGQDVDLAITGMTCASCAHRIERKLTKLEGVTASVNYATETAHVTAPVGYDLQRLLDTVSAAGYGASVPEPDAEPEDGDPVLAGYARRLVVSAVLTVPLVVLSMVMPLQFPGWTWVALVLAAPVVTWGAWPFHRAAVLGARHGATTMDTLVSLGVTASTVWSVAVLVSGPDSGHLYLETAAVITTFLLAGRWLERRARRSAGAALRSLLEAGAREATLLPGWSQEHREDGVERTVPVAELAVDDVVLVRPGQQLPTDGVVLSGASAIDASVITGESVPVDAGPGDEVVGGTLNVGGRLVVRATAVGEQTRLAQLARMVEEAQTGKAAAQRLADRISGVFVPVVLVIALATLVGWVALTGDLGSAVTAAVAVLVVACPCVLGLATPTALVAGTGRGAQLGILVRGPEALEAARAVSVVALDKTGTLTTGRMSLVGVVAASAEAVEVHRVAGALESASDHPVARAIAEDRPVDGARVEDFADRPGHGVVGTVVSPDGTALRAVVGRPELLEREGLTISPVLHTALDASREQGRTAVLVGWDGEARGLLEVADTVRDGAADAVAELRRLGLRPVLLTGDHEAAARGVAAQVGIDEVVAGVVPEEKVDAVRRLQSDGTGVAMVGDGVNDAAALATADLGIAMGTGTDAAKQAGDLVLVRGDLAVVADAVRLSRRTLGTIRANLFWAFGYNVAALPLAALGLLNPMIAGAAMAASSVCVVANSLRLRRFR